MLNDIASDIADYYFKRDNVELVNNVYKDKYDAIEDISNQMSNDDGLENIVDELLIDLKRFVFNDNLNTEKYNNCFKENIKILYSINDYVNQYKLNEIYDFQI